MLILMLMLILMWILICLCASWFYLYFHLCHLPSWRSEGMGSATNIYPTEEIKLAWSKKVSLFVLLLLPFLLCANHHRHRHRHYHCHCHCPPVLPTITSILSLFYVQYNLLLSPLLCLSLLPMMMMYREGYFFFRCLLLLLRSLYPCCFHHCQEADMTCLISFVVCFVSILPRKRSLLPYLLYHTLLLVFLMCIYYLLHACQSTLPLLWRLLLLRRRCSSSFSSSRLVSSRLVVVVGVVGVVSVVGVVVHVLLILDAIMLSSRSVSLLDRRLPCRWWWIDRVTSFYLLLHLSQRCLHAAIRVVLVEYITLVRVVVVGCLCLRWWWSGWSVLFTLVRWWRGGGGQMIERRIHVLW